MADATSFVGLSKKAAQNRAESLNLIFRLIRVDTEAFLGYPEETRDDRICIEIDKGTVSKATIQ